MEQLSYVPKVGRSFGLTCEEQKVSFPPMQILRK
jgi:hypothetical protein